jgi:hypothetical protein
VPGSNHHFCADPAVGQGEKNLAASLLDHISQDVLFSWFLVHNLRKSAQSADHSLSFFCQRETSADFTD